MSTEHLEETEKVNLKAGSPFTNQGMVVVGGKVKVDDYNSF